MNVLALSIGRQILQTESRERKRMRQYAAHLKEFHIVVLTRKEHDFHEEVHDGTLHIYPTNSVTRIGMLIDAFLVARRIIKKCQKEVVITSQDPFEMGFISYLLSRNENTTLHIQVHGDYFGSRAWVRGARLHIFRLYMARFILARADRIRVVSERIKHSLTMLGVPEKRITVLPIRPELETFLRVSHEVDEHDPFVFLAASRFSPEKNIPLLVRAFSRVQAQYPHTRLRLVGKGTEEHMIRSCISALGIAHVVSLVPWTDAIEEEMQRADVFVLTSNHEAYGLTLIEAMAVGLPIVTTDVGCVGEVFKNSIHGIVVPVGDEAALTQALLTMLQQKNFRKSCSIAGRTTAELLARQSPDDYARAWVAALSDSVVNVY